MQKLKLRMFLCNLQDRLSCVLFRLYGKTTTIKLLFNQVLFELWQFLPELVASNECLNLYYLIQVISRFINKNLVLFVKP